MVEHHSFSERETFQELADHNLHTRIVREDEEIQELTEKVKELENKNLRIRKENYRLYLKMKKSQKQLKASELQKQGKGHSFKGRNEDGRIRDLKQKVMELQETVLQMEGEKSLLAAQLQVCQQQLDKKDHALHEVCLLVDKLRQKRKGHFGIAANKKVKILEETVKRMRNSYLDALKGKHLLNRDLQDSLHMMKAMEAERAEDLLYISKLHRQVLGPRTSSEDIVL